MKSQELYQRACKIMPGGVNSPVRAFKSVNMTPLFIKEANGSKIYDVDNKEYIDYVGSWGPMVLGHKRKEVIQSIIDAANKGTSYGAPSENELVLAELMIKSVPSLEMIRMTNSGTEAVMSAIRVARGYTKRDKILKFEGCYHGHSDGLLVKSGSGAMTFSVPDSQGVPSDYVKNTLIGSYNDLDGVSTLIEENSQSLAAVIIEPVAANMGVIPPEKEFLRVIRKLTEKYGILLIFDEVITGFRLGLSGAQGYLGITPDLSCYGKIIGGGLPVGAYGGKKEIMEMVAPIGPVYQAGTLSGNPVAMAAGIKTLEILRNEPKIYIKLEAKAEKLEKAFLKASSENNIPVVINRVGSLMSVFFNNQSINNYSSALSSDTDLFAKYFKYMLDEGIYLAPSQFEAIFLSDAHTEKDISATARALDIVFKKISEER